jgi:hypothetical protein
MPLARALAVISLVLLAACGRGSKAAPGFAVSKGDLTAAHDRLAAARAQLAVQPGAAFRIAILVEPFGSQLNSNVQSFFNNHAGALYACLADDPAAAALDALYRYDGAGHTALAVFDAELERRADAEACMAAILADGPLAQPRAAGSIAFIPAALVAR